MSAKGTIANFWSFVVEYKVQVLIAIIFIIICVWFYRRGRDKAPAQGRVPYDEGSGNVNSISADQVAAYANRLWIDIDTIFAVRDGSLYKELTLLSDTDLVRIYNEYNRSYSIKDGGTTLIQAIDGEFTETADMKTVKNRLRKQGLK